jgi:hypothetical protein
MLTSNANFRNGTTHLPYSLHIAYNFATLANVAHQLTHVSGDREVKRPKCPCVTRVIYPLQLSPLLTYGPTCKAYLQLLHFPLLHLHFGPLPLPHSCAELTREGRSWPHSSCSSRTGRQRYPLQPTRRGRLYHSSRVVPTYPPQLPRSRAGWSPHHSRLFTITPPGGATAARRASLGGATAAAWRASPGGAAVAGMMPATPRRAPARGSCGRGPRELRLGSSAERHGLATSVEKRCREVEDDHDMWVPHVREWRRSLMEISWGHFGLFTSKSSLCE